tara:strand:- start:154 stop:525 length:372 start_codon:yes stop_codon:yes gene_type:complete
MSQWLLVASGGALGSISRYAINLLAISRLNSNLLGTFIVNISGSLILGIIIGFLDNKSGESISFRLFAIIGFLGSYTTFSTLTVASAKLFFADELIKFLSNILLSILIGVIAASLGILIGKNI